MVKASPGYPDVVRGPTGSIPPATRPTCRRTPSKETAWTTSFGVPVDGTDDSVKVSPRGPTLLDDFHLRDKIMHFDHERIPERVVHARGVAAHGVFRPYRSMGDVTSAAFLADPDVTTPVFVRFSTVPGIAWRPETTAKCGARHEVLHICRQLRPRREQHSRVLHPGRDQVP